MTKITQETAKFLESKRKNPIHVICLWGFKQIVKICWAFHMKAKPKPKLIMVDGVIDQWLQFDWATTHIKKQTQPSDLAQALCLVFDHVGYTAHIDYSNVSWKFSIVPSTELPYRWEPVGLAYLFGIPKKEEEGWVFGVFNQSLYIKRVLHDG